MPEQQESFNQMMQDQLILLEALHDILMSSTEADIVRIATMALTRTQAGINYLTANPITL